MNDARNAARNIKDGFKADGYGDGPMNPLDPTSPGGRPTLQNNGTFLRITHERPLVHGDYVFMGQQLLRVETV